MGINTMMELAGFSFRKFRVGGKNCRKSRKTVRKRKNFRKLRKTAWKRKNLGELWGDRHRGDKPGFWVFFWIPPPLLKTLTSDKSLWHPFFETGYRSYSTVWTHNDGNVGETVFFCTMSHPLHSPKIQFLNFGIVSHLRRIYLVYNLYFVDQLIVPKIISLIFISEKERRIAKLVTFSWNQNGVN